jgi:hypothetical protein
VLLYPGVVNSLLTGQWQIELTSPAASEQSRLDCEAICKLGLKAKVDTVACCHRTVGLTPPDPYTYQMSYG